MSDIKELIFSSKIIFWDFDGVIKKSNQVKNDAFFNLFEDIKKEQKDYILSHHINNQGLSRFKKIPYYMEYLGIETKESNVHAYLNRFSELVFDGVINSDWVEGVLEILSELDKSILITATPQDEIERIIEKIEIGKFFKKVYGSPKTKTECVEDFIESKDINLNDCLFIGDSKSDLQCANHFDMKFLFIKNEYNKHVIVDEDIPQVENFL